MPRGQEGTLCLSLSSEPDLITAHTGHPINVAQHWETDETCGSEIPGDSVTLIPWKLGDHSLPLGDSEAFGTSKMAGEQSSREAGPFPIPRLVRRPPGSGSRSSGWLLS